MQVNVVGSVAYRVLEHLEDDSLRSCCCLVHALLGDISSRPFSLRAGRGCESDGGSNARNGVGGRCVT